MKTTKKPAHGPSRNKTRAFVLGRAQFAKISAVEGVKLPDDLLQKFEEFDRNKLSAKDRRRAIISRYAKPTV